MANAGTIGMVIGVIEAIFTIINVGKVIWSFFKKDVSTMGVKSSTETALWVINPFNIFRKP
jgi:hypothetical protein